MHCSLCSGVSGNTLGKGAKSRMQRYAKFYLSNYLKKKKENTYPFQAGGGCWSLSHVVTGQEVGYTLDSLPVCVNLIKMSLF